MLVTVTVMLLQRMQRWACERLFAIAGELALSMQGASLRRWKLVCDRERRAKKIIAYLRSCKIL
jgi:hypothetical protein